jgi:L-fuculose-phosphate aldolase
MTEQSLREAIAEASRLIWGRGWVANHDGNLTAKTDDGRILATPTAVSKRAIGPDHVLALGADGKLLENQRLPGKPFSELHLHLACYAARPDAKAVLHAHPPIATGFGVAGLPLTTPVIAEAVVSLGPGAPLVPYFRPGSKELDVALAAALGEADAALLANHGVIAVGADVEQAYLRTELVEQLAKVTLAARQIGRVNALPPADVAFLLERRAAAGLGPAARGEKPKPAPAPVPPPAAVEPPQCGDGPGTLPVASLDPAAVERAVRDELARLGLGRP